MSTETTRVKFSPSQRWVLALASLGSLMVLLDMLVVTTALTTIRLHLHASIDELEWTVNAYTLSFAVLLMTASAFGDRFGRRRLFVLGLAVFTAASILCAVSTGIGLLITARVIQGAGSAMIMPHAMALLSAVFPPQQRARALGIFSSVSGLATLGGPLVGGAVVQGLAWQWIFWLNVPIGIVLIPLVLAKIEESSAPGTGLDFGGLILVTLGAFGLVWGLVRGQSSGWGSTEIVGSLVGGAVVMVAFVVFETRFKQPMLPMRFFRSASFSSGNAAGFLMYGAVFGAAFFLAQFLQTTMHYDPLGAGLRLLPWTVTLFIVAPFAGAQVNKFGERPLIVVGLLLQAAGFAWIALMVKPTMSYTSMIVPLVVAGGGVSLAMPAAQNSVIGAVPREAIGKASGAFNMLRQLGGTFGIAVLAAVFAAKGSYASPKAFSDGFGPAIGVAAAFSLAAAIAGFWTPGKRAAAPAPGGAAQQPAAAAPAAGQR